MGEDLLAERGVDHLGVELDPEDPAFAGLEGGYRRLGRGRQLGEALGRLVDGVAMGHPAGLLAGQALEQQPGLANGQLRAAVLAHLGRLDPAAELPCQKLHPVTDAQHRDPELQEPGVELRGALLVNRGRAAGEDQALGTPAGNLFGANVVGKQLREDPTLADATGDQL